MLYPTMNGVALPAWVATGFAHDSTTPWGFGTAVSDCGGAGTSSGTIEARLDTSLRADSPSVTTAYVSRTTWPSFVRSSGESSYVSRAPTVADGSLAFSMLSSRSLTLLKWTRVTCGILAQSATSRGTQGAA